MSDTKLAVLDREAKGTGGAKRTRNEGFVPGVLYGRDNQGQPVKIEASALRKIISRMGSSAIFDAEYDGEPKLIMLKEVQNEPVSGEVLHVDLFEISADEAIITTVPLVAVGVDGITGGGMLQQMMSELQVSCLPKFVPNSIEFDVSGIQIGQALYVSDLKFEGDIEVLNSPEEMVANVIEPKGIDEETEEEEEEEEGAETAEAAEEATEEE
ncbi:MAG: 50S ribosomal protein L25 [Firmicutes bacterium]|nr:50S ribosomal protein L25 [Bacillota bacterium]